MPLTPEDVSNKRFTPVRLREGYSYDTAQYNYDVVSGMSAPTTKTNYQSWFNYPNPASPQVTIGKEGNATVAPISSMASTPDGVSMMGSTKSVSFAFFM